MLEVEDWIEELIKKIMDTYGCNRRQAMEAIKRIHILNNLLNNLL